ncbi:MAG: PUA domain-containing protein [Promethearchaeota archaeon]
MIPINLDRDWILEISRRTGFSVPTIQKLIEVCYFQNKQQSLQKQVKDLISALRTPQEWFSLRINPVRMSQQTDNNIRKKLKEEFEVSTSKIIQNLYFLPVKGPFELQKHTREIIVDKFAAESIMTGANLYIPGFLRPLPKFQRGEIFSIYGPNHIQVANGITQYSHKEILELKNGLGIQTTESRYKIPSYRDSDYYDRGIISDHSFGPFLACNLLMEFYKDKEQDVIFDLCSAPGHKTCTLSEIGYQKHGNFPKIISIDRSTKRLKTLHQDIKRLGLENIQVIPKRIERIPTYHPDLLNTADLLVFDPPCSALGTRPKLSITHTEEGLRSFFLLQRRLTKEISSLLKENGILLYTTCTLTVLENEGIISILMRKHGYKLLDAHQLLSKVIHPAALSKVKTEILPGISRDEDLLQKIPFADPKHQEDLDRYLTLSKEDARKMIRMNPMGTHSTGYFIALLQKHHEH